MLQGLFQNVLGNLIASAIGAAIVALVTIAYFKVRRILFERQFPVDGEYISAFEDEVHGKKVWTRSKARLTQSGKVVKGTDRLADRTWKIEGEVSPDGHFHGRYWAADARDRGLGNFILNLDQKGDLEGLWAGYDSVNQKIVAGRYRMRRVIRVGVEPLTEAHHPVVLAIAESRLGEAYITPEALKDQGAHRVVAVADGKVVGFCLSKMLAAGEFVKPLGLKAGEGRRLGHGLPIGVIQSMAVSSDHEGRGIGDTLVQESQDWFVKAGLSQAAMTGWKSSRGCHIEGLALRHGFDRIKEIKDYWRKASIKGGFHCPECGAPPCRCSAVLFVKELR